MHVKKKKMLPVKWHLNRGVCLIKYADIDTTHKYGQINILF